MNIIRVVADLIRWMQAALLLVPGLFGLLWLPAQIEQIYVPYQNGRAWGVSPAYYQGILPQVLGHAFAAWCIVFGWLLLIALVVAQLWSAPWRLLLWAVVIAHNLTILWCPYWPIEPRPYIIPVFVIVTSIWAAIFDTASMQRKSLRH